MATTLRPPTLILFVGDLVFFTLALWLSLFLRVLEVPSSATLYLHLVPFALLFAVWAGVFFIAGLYESRSIILERRALSATLLVAQTINIAIAAVFFFFVPLFGIAPKTLLVIYLVVSFLSVLLWRVALFPRLGVQRTENAVVVGECTEVRELVNALNRAHRAPARIVARIEPGESALGPALEEAIREQKVRAIIADFDDERVAKVFPSLYSLLAQDVRFFDAMALYEDVFGRIPLAVLNERWLARNISRYAHTFYDTLKRLMDVALAVVGGTLSLVVYPFVALAIKLEDGGPVFVALERIGEGGRRIYIHKFRSMSGNDGGNYGPSGTTKLTVTRVGKVLRTTRFDELPQFWNVVRGDLSLIGPRPEAPALVAVYEKEIPYYGVRHLIKPGLSGWAQLYHHADPHHAADVEATRAKLSYDLFYLKHRSLLLDLTIALKTIRRVLMRGNA